MNENYCNNCGRQGHNYNNCKIPITSVGAIVLRNNILGENENSTLEFLMIRRKDTLGFIDFMRGKYSVYNKHYIMNMLKQMTVQEKECLKSGDFGKCWYEIWRGNAISSQYRAEESQSRDKFNLLVAGIVVKNDYYNLISLVEESSLGNQWTEPEWGFPKGRRNYQEKDYECALREFTEETGYVPNKLINIQNILPYEETFTGSNYKSYKHKYYVMFMKYQDSLDTVNYEKSEVSAMEWKTYDECMDSIRPYNLEKKRLITDIYEGLSKYQLFIV
jgi:8-oxo-dGTP pyrophosphatase MutT (NUDIX family)